MSARDKLLTEAMGRCWHEDGEPIQHHIFIGTKFRCAKCGEEYWARNSHIEFSDWIGFGLLWEWATEQGWWEELWHEITAGYNYMAVNSAGMRPYLTGVIFDLIQPDRFADAVYDFLKERG